MPNPDERSAVHRIGLRRLGAPQLRPVPGKLTGGQSLTIPDESSGFRISHPVIDAYAGGDVFIGSRLPAGRVPANNHQG